MPSVLTCCVAVVLLAQSEARDCSNGACAADDDAAAMLQTRSPLLRNSVSVCEEGDHVPCPGSGNMCAGNQCCPRTAESGGKTFPCPSAADSFAGCENNTKLGSCPPGGGTATTLAVGEEEGPPGGGTPTTLMVGEEESPTATTLMVGEEESPPGGGTPTTLMVGEEEGPTATTLMVGEEESPPGGGTATTLAVGEEEGPPPAGCKEGDHVPCPGSGNMCAGNQCCPRTAESGGKTFPCPSAADSFAGCENNTKLGTCLPGGVTAASLMVGAEQGSPGGGTPTTRMVGEEGGPTATTLMVGEEESPTATTLMVGEEESPMATTLMVGEEESPPGGGTATTLMVGEEEGPTATTLAVGEEEGPTATTLMVGEEEGPTATTLMVGEEESPPGGGMATTLAVGEEEGPPPAGCKEGDQVPCPGSGNMCAGNQCCPGTAESGGKTFPCPSAADSFADCENNTKLGTCPPGGGTATTLMVGEEVYSALGQASEAIARRGVPAGAAGPPQRLPPASASAAGGQCTVLVAGGEADYNLQSLLQRLEGSEGRCQVVRLLVSGAKGSPQVAWDLETDSLTVDGTPVKPTAMFLRYDVFGTDVSPLTRQAFWELFDGYARSHSQQVRLLNVGYGGKTNKLMTLMMAKSLGLETPQTLATNSPVMATDYLGQHASKITKPLGGGATTKRLHEVVDRSQKGMPAAFVQEELISPEMRVFGVDGAFLCLGLHSPSIDYREHQDAKLSLKSSCPAELVPKLHSIMNRMGLRYGAADFKTRASDGAWVFLEMNSEPMFSAFDKASGGLLRDMIGSWLEGNFSPYRGCTDAKSPVMCVKGSEK